MSLVRLLTAGKSLVGLKQSSGRYRLPSRGCCPNSNRKKNPFRSDKTEAAKPGRMPLGAASPNSPR